MKNPFVRSLVATLAFSVIVPACDNSTAPPDEGEVADAVVGALMSNLDAGAGAGAASVASGGSTAAPSDTTKRTQDSKACPLNAATGYFVCAPVTLPNGMTANSSFQLLDAADAPRTKYDSLVVKLRRISSMTGTLTQPIQTPNGPVNATQTIAQHVTVVLTGFRANAPEQNGTGRMTNTIVPEGLPTGNVTVAKTVAGLRIDPSPTGPKYPIAGTITSVVTSQQGTGPAFTSTQVTTYNGSAIATTVITPQNGPVRTCTYDMTKKEPPVCTP